MLDMKSQFHHGLGRVACFYSPWLNFWQTSIVKGVNHLPLAIEQGFKMRRSLISNHRTCESSSVLRFILIWQSCALGNRKDSRFIGNDFLNISANRR
jgi:hypothetical protein